jgi:hypothetical protein
MSEIGESFLPEEIVVLTTPSFVGCWPVNALEIILSVLRKSGKVCIKVDNFEKRCAEVPTLAEILYQ